MTQVLTPQREVELEQRPSGPDRSSKRLIVRVALAAVVVGAVVGLVLFSAGESATGQAGLAEAARWEAMGDYYRGPWEEQQAQVQATQQARAAAMVDYYQAQWLAQQARIQQIQEARAAAMVKFYEKHWETQGS